MESRKKDVKVTFFISGQSDKSKKIETGNIFSESFKKFSNDSLKAFTADKVIGKEKNKELVLKILSYDSNEGRYFGYVGIYRDSLLPAVFNKKSFADNPIPMQNDDEILEKCYFTYYELEDVLAFQQNHLGPRADDLAYVLFKMTGMKRVYFDPIWNKQDIRLLLETGKNLRKGTLTLALPRKFEKDDFDFSNSWGNDVVKMMSDNGMSRMSLNFWGRASLKKTTPGYIADNVRDGLKELISKFSVSQRTDNSPQIKKADVEFKDGKTQSLLDQELSTKVKVDVINGYPTVIDIRNGLNRAKLICKDQLSSYIKSN